MPAKPPAQPEPGAVEVYKQQLVVNSIHQLRAFTISTMDVNTMLPFEYPEDARAFIYDQLVILGARFMPK